MAILGKYFSNLARRATGLVLGQDLSSKAQALTDYKESMRQGLKQPWRNSATATPQHNPATANSNRAPTNQQAAFTPKVSVRYGGSENVAAKPNAPTSNRPLFG
jgi:hypothetical protein